MPGLWQQGNLARSTNTTDLRRLIEQTQARGQKSRSDAVTGAGKNILDALARKRDMQFEAGEAEKERGFLSEEARAERSYDSTEEARALRWRDIKHEEEVAKTLSDAALERDRRNNEAAMARVREQNPSITGEKIDRVVDTFLGRYLDLRAEGILAPDQLDSQIESHLNAAVANGLIDSDQAKKAEAQIRAWIESQIAQGGPSTADGDPRSHPGPAGGFLPPGDQVPISADRAAEILGLLEQLDSSIPSELGEGAFRGGALQDRTAVKGIRNDLEDGSLDEGWMEVLQALLEKYGEAPALEPSPLPGTDPWMPSGAGEQLLEPSLGPAEERLKAALEMMNRNPGTGTSAPPTIKTQEELDRWLKARRR